MNYEEILKLSVFQTPQSIKEAVFLPYLSKLTLHHSQQSPVYKAILEAFNNEKDYQSLSDIPFLPVSLFKEIDLKSIPESEVYKTVMSSGTTGQAVSKIYLDKTTASNQQRTLAKIVGSFLGSSRVPMIIVDSPNVIKDRLMFSGRGVGILGFAIFGSKTFYALKDDMSLDIDGLQSFIEQYKNQRILVFGFTFMIWQHLIKELEKLDIKLVFQKRLLFMLVAGKNFTNNIFQITTSSQV